MFPFSLHHSPLLDRTMRPSFAAKTAYAMLVRMGVARAVSPTGKAGRNDTFAFGIIREVRALISIAV